MRLDCTGQRCPQPVIELARAARAAQPGATITIVTDDPAALIDIPAWSRMRGHDCRRVDDDGSSSVHEVTLRA